MRDRRLMLSMMEHFNENDGVYTNDEGKVVGVDMGTHDLMRWEDDDKLIRTKVSSDNEATQVNASTD